MKLQHLVICIALITSCKLGNQNEPDPSRVSYASEFGGTICTNYKPGDQCQLSLQGYIASSEDLEKFKEGVLYLGGLKHVLENRVIPESFKTLSNVELVAIVMYTDMSGYYKEMNKALRGNSAAWTPLINSLIYSAASGLNKLQNESSLTCRGQTVYRGESFETHPINLLTLYKKKEKLIESGFMSTSGTRAVAESFVAPGRGIIYEIECATGVNISPLAMRSDEREFLFVPGTFFQATEVIEPDQQAAPIIIKLREVTP